MVPPALLYVAYVLFGLTVLYLVGIPVFYLTANLKKRPDGTLVIDRNSWHFQIVNDLIIFRFFSGKNSKAFQQKLKDVKAKRVKICGYYAKFYLMSLLTLVATLIFTVIFLFARFIALVANIITILLFGNVTWLNFASEGNLFKTYKRIPLPRVFGHRVWPVVYFAVAAMIYYWPAYGNSVAASATAVVSGIIWTWVFYLIFYLILALFSLLLVALFIRAGLQNKNKVSLARVWIKARYEKACPWVEVE